MIAELHAVTNPPRIAFRWLAMIVAIVALESWLLALHPGFWFPAVALSLLVGGTNVHFAEMRRKDRALIKAHEEAEHLAAIAERERIARDLHDLLGHTLSVIVLKSELVAKIADRDPVRATAEIRDVERISRSALAEVRRAIHGYRGERLADEMTAARRALEAAGVSLEEELGSVALGVDEERALALGLREACTNVVRHARATRCRVTLTQAAGVVRLTIHDDGVGGVLEEGAGLAGMRGRLTAVGGRVLRDGSNGTRLMLEVPARAQSASERWLHRDSHPDCRGSGDGPRRAGCFAGNRTGPRGRRAGPLRHGGAGPGPAAPARRRRDRHRDARHERTGSRCRAAARRTSRARPHAHDLRAARLSATRPRRGRGRLPAQGRSFEPARRRNPPRGRRRPRRGPRAGRRGLDRTRPAHRPRASGAAAR